MDASRPTPSTPPTVLRAGAFEIRLAERQLLVDGQPAKLGARAFDLLAALVERRGRTVGKNELLELVWPGVVVEENNLQVQVSALRKLLGPQAIATIPGRGYRFTLAVTTGTEGQVREAPARVAQAATTPAPLDDAPPATAADAPHLIGRAHELAQVRDLVHGHRLVTLVGAGGIGKTSLARAAAQALHDDASRVCWVDLAAIAEPDKVVAAAAQALGASLPPDAPPQRALALALAEQTLLLVLDNCEHVVDAVAALVDALLAHAPGVRVLATSQEPIGLPLEHQLRLGTLAVPSPAEADDVAVVAASGATALLVERARAADPHFALKAENASAVVDICRRLDGIPLAIELAAARVKLLGVAGLRAKLGERFRVLTAGSRLALRRHQTLRAALDWSHELLTPDEQTVFRRLGVFAGGWTLEAAQQVAADDAADNAVGEAASTGIDEWAVLEHLGTLVEKSMVVAEGADRPRYRLLETTRAYALERLAQAGETEALTRRHARVMCALLTDAYEARFGEDGTISEADYVVLTRPEVDDLRAALAWAMAGDPPLTVALASVSAAAFTLSGLDTEALAMLRRALPIAGEGVEDARTARLWCEAVAWGGERALPDEVYLPALALAERGCRHHRWARALYRVLFGKAWRLLRLQEFDAARPVMDEVMALASPDWPGWLRTDVLSLQTLWNQQAGKSEDNPPIRERAAALLPARGEESRRFRLAIGRADGYRRRGEFQAAAALLEPMVDAVRTRRGSPTSESTRSARQMGWAYGHLVLSLVYLGRLDEAGVRLRQALPCWRAGAVLRVWLYAAIRLVVAQGRVADAMRLTAAEERMSNYGRYDTMSWGTRQDSLRLIEAAEPDAARRAQWRREGEALDEDAICALCLGRSGEAPTVDGG